MDAHVTLQIRRAVEGFPALGTAVFRLPRRFQRRIIGFHDKTRRIRELILGRVGSHVSLDAFQRVEARLTNGTREGLGSFVARHVRNDGGFLGEAQVAGRAVERFCSQVKPPMVI